MDLGLRSDDRVLILGSSGWFGRECMELLNTREVTAEVLCVPGPSVATRTGVNDLQEFRPTVVINFAFLTRERVAVEGVMRYLQVNSKLTDSFARISDHKSVRLAVAASSGSAVTEPEHPYGLAMALQESRARELVSPSRSVVTIRTYSVSGVHVRRPREYAFSDLVLQAGSGHVNITANRLVFRRYVAVQDLLEVALICGLSGASGTLESGGELVEMGDLASRIVHIVNPAAEVTRADQISDVPNFYCADNRSWEEWVSRSGVSPLDLDEQITAVAQGLVDD